MPRYLSLSSLAPIARRLAAAAGRALLAPRPLLSAPADRLTGRQLLLVRELFG